MARLVPYIRYFGDKEHGKLFTRPGLSELARTVSIAEDAGYSTYQRRVVLDEDTNTYALLRVDAGVHALNIYAGVPLPEEPEEEITPPEKEREKEKYPAVALWSGMAHIHHILYGAVDPTRPTNNYPFMTEFKPTKATFKQYPKDFPEGLDYQVVSRQALTMEQNLEDPQYADRLGPSERPPGGSDKTSQTDMIRPCRFTGLLAEAVAVTMAYGTFNTDGDTRVRLLPTGTDPDYKSAVRTYGFQPQYDWLYERSHGIGRDSKGKLWLIECSYANGIIARKLPMLSTQFVKIKSLDPEGAKVIRKLGGYPSGESFPYDVSGLIADGTVIQLLSPEDYQLYFTDDHYQYADAHWIGWSFSDASNEARICNYDTLEDQGYFNNHYLKMTFTINVSGQVPTGSAKIEEIDSGYLDIPVQSTGYGGSGIYFYNTDNRRYVNMNPYSPSGGDFPGSGDVDQVIWVAWMEDHWSEIHYTANTTQEKTSRGNFSCSPNEFKSGSGRYDYSADGTFGGPTGVWAYTDSSYTSEIPRVVSSIHTTDGDYMRLTGSSGEQMEEWCAGTACFWQIWAETTYQFVLRPYPRKATAILINPYARAGYFFYRFDVRAPQKDVNCIQRFRYKTYPHIWAGVNWSVEEGDPNAPYPPGVPYPPDPPTEVHPYASQGWLTTSAACTNIIGGYDVSEHPDTPSCENSPSEGVWIDGYFTFGLEPEGCNHIADSVPWSVAAGPCTQAPEGNAGDYTTLKSVASTVGYRTGVVTQHGEGSTSFESWLVCPGFKGHVKKFPSYSKAHEDWSFGILNFQYQFFQYSTTGPKAAIYTNPTKTINPSDMYESELEVEAEGTWPGMPSDGDHSTHRTLSFVGINGP